nr:HD domain-containing phosphohydrolase [Clostridioides sp.]
MRDVIFGSGFEESTEKKYLEFNSSENTTMAKLGLPLYISITLFYAISSIISTNEVNISNIIIIYLILLIPMFIVLGLSFTKFGQKNIIYILSVFLIFSGAYLCYMLVSFRFNTIYFIGLFFLYFSIYSLFNLGTKLTHIVGWSIAIIYFVLYSVSENEFSNVFIKSSIILIGTNGVGILSNYYREDRLRRNFFFGVETSKENKCLSKDIEILRTKLHDSKETLSYTVENLIINIDNDFGEYIKRLKTYVKIISSSYADANLSPDQKVNFVDNMCYATTFHKLDDFLTGFNQSNILNSVGILQNTISLHPNDDVMNYVSIIENGCTEFFDGSGAPNRLSGNDIPIEARIMSAVDLYYEFITAIDPEMDHFESLTELEKCSGSIIDPYIYDLFVQNSEKFQIKII